MFSNRPSFLFSIVAFFFFLFAFYSVNSVNILFSFPFRLFQSPIFPALLFGRTGFPLAHQRTLNRRTALFALLQFLDFGCENFTGNLLVLGSGSSGLALDYDPGWFMDELDGGVCFVLVLVFFGVS